MLSKSLVPVLALAILLLPSSALPLPHGTARLNGAQEVPPVVTPATGTASLRLSADRTELAFDITVSGLSSAMSVAHFHSAPTGQNGGVVRTITPDFSGNTASGVWRATDAEPLTPARVAEIFAGNIYLNVHTTNHPGGEIRGQLDVIAGLHARASLDGAQEVPPVVTPATATGVFTLTDAGVNFDITVQGLSSAMTAAHFHNAPAGVNGGVVRTITPQFTGNTATGIWTRTDAEPLTPALIAELLAGRIYVNIHTTTNPGGEVRGQVLLANSSGFTGRMDATQEVPPLPAGPTGTGSFSLNETRNELTFHVTVQGLSSAITAAHFHNNAFGINGGVVRTIAPPERSGNNATGVWRSTDAEPLTPTLVNELLAGRIYVNWHTTNNPGGEIRGQLRLTTGIGRTATLDGNEEVPPVATNGTGTGSFVIVDQGMTAPTPQIVFDATVAVENLTGPITLAHIHNAPPGVNGGVVKDLTGAFTGATATGSWRPSDFEPLTPAQIGQYITRNHYMNVHTQMHQGGEIRGQLDPATFIGIAPAESAPITSALRQNYPNPFNPTTTIRYELAAREHVTLAIYDLTGRKVQVLVDEVQAGPQAVSVDAQSLASGVYFYQLATPSFTDTKKLVITK